MAATLLKYQLGTYITIPAPASARLFRTRIIVECSPALTIVKLLQRCSAWHLAEGKQMEGEGDEIKTESSNLGEGELMDCQTTAAMFLRTCTWEHASRWKTEKMEESQGRK